MRFVRKFLQSKLRRGQNPDPEENEQFDEETPSLYQSENKKPVILVTMIEVENETKQLIITKTSETYSENFEVVYVVDDPDFSILRRNDQMFEYFPSTLQQRLHSNVLPWPVYLAERWVLLLSKWNPNKIISFGRNIDSFLSAAPSSSVGR